MAALPSFGLIIGSMVDPLHLLLLIYLSRSLRGGQKGEQYRTL
uniref:Uncharacterized protein n=1 Tax=Arundo donax TaxID=35708 RepID=A0A0A9BL74_ARUDO